jgi:hypothetical protein
MLPDGLWLGHDRQSSQWSKSWGMHVGGLAKVGMTGMSTVGVKVRGLSVVLSALRMPQMTAVLRLWLGHVLGSGHNLHVGGLVSTGCQLDPRWV